MVSSVVLGGQERGLVLEGGMGRKLVLAAVVGGGSRGVAREGKQKEDVFMCTLTKSVGWGVENHLGGERRGGVE